MKGEIGGVRGKVADWGRVSYYLLLVVLVDIIRPNVQLGLLPGWGPVKDLERAQTMPTQGHIDGGLLSHPTGQPTWGRQPGDWWSFLATPPLGKLRSVNYLVAQSPGRDGCFARLLEFYLRKANK